MKLLVAVVLLQAISLGVIAWLALGLRRLTERHERLKEAHARDTNELNVLRGRRDHAVMVEVHKREAPSNPGSPGDLPAP